MKNLLTFHSRRERQRRKHIGGVSRFEFAEAKINFETFEATVRDEPVRLTQLEMTLLRYFVENENRVIPRRELLENVWGMPGSINTRAPDQFIRRLRKTFEPDPAQPRHFLTIRDAGYRFVAKPEGEGEEEAEIQYGGRRMSELYGRRVGGGNGGGENGARNRFQDRERQ